MTNPEETLAVLQRFVDGYSDATEVAMQALADPSTPAEARRLMCGALNYVLDLLDMFPDQSKKFWVALRSAAESYVNSLTVSLFATARPHRDAVDEARV